MLRKLNKAGVILISLFLLGSLTRAQSTNSGSQQPLPPISPLGANRTVGGPVPTPGDSSPRGDQQWTADSRPLAGAQELTLGSSGSAHNFLLPSLSIVTQAGTNPFSTPGPGPSHPTVFSTSYLAGRLGLNRVSGRSELLLDYVAGAAFSNDAVQGNSMIQGLDVTETIHLGRWSLLFGDQASYLSNSAFGFGGLGGLKNLGVGLGNGVGSSPGISPSFAPGDSAFIYGVRRVNNTALGQTTYALSHRSLLTFVGSYESLNFVDSTLQNSSVLSFQGAYSYLLSRQNSFSALYRFDTFSFSGVTQSIHVHSTQLAFARRITGRLTWQVGAGPSFQQYQKPLNGPATPTRPTAFTSLKYRLRYTGFGFNYAHVLTKGSGVLAGAETDSFSGLVTRTFSRDWDASLDAGYSRNQAVRQTFGPTARASTPKAWFTTVRVNRRFVGYGALFLAYNAAGQSSLTSICTALGCRADFITHTVSIGYTWGLRPVME